MNEHPDEPHEFSMTCIKCGKVGMVHLSIITPDQRVTILDEEPPPGAEETLDAILSFTPGVDHAQD